MYYCFTILENQNKIKIQVSCSFLLIVKTVLNIAKLTLALSNINSILILDRNGLFIIHHLKGRDTEKPLSCSRYLQCPGWRLERRCILGLTQEEIKCWSASPAASQGKHQQDRGMEHGIMSSWNAGTPSEAITTVQEPTPEVIIMFQFVLT